MAHGVTFVERAPGNAGVGVTGNSAPRENHTAPMKWPLMETGKPVAVDAARSDSSGVGLIRSLDASARGLGVQILLKHRMTAMVRENQLHGLARCTVQGRLAGINAAAEP